MRRKEGWGVPHLGRFDNELHIAATHIVLQLEYNYQHHDNLIHCCALILVNDKEHE